MAVLKAAEITIIITIVLLLLVLLLPRAVLVVVVVVVVVVNRKFAGSIPAGVSGFFIDIKSFRSHYGHGVDSVSNRNEYQEYSLGVKVAGV